MRLHILIIVMIAHCSNALFALDKAEKVVLGKLKLIIGTQSVVYAEHAAVHLYAKNQATRMSELFNVNDERGMSCLLDTLCLLNEEAEKVYRTKATVIDDSLIERLRTSQERCVRWSLAISIGNTLPRKSWDQFRQAFRDKAEVEELLLHKAMSARDEYALGRDLSCVLSKELAVTAWCVELPALE